MINLSDFGYTWTYSMAAYVRLVIMGEREDEFRVEEIIDLSEEYFLKKAFKPDRHTLLHDVVDCLCTETIEYHGRKTLSTEDLLGMLEKYDVGVYGKSVYENTDTFRESRYFEEGLDYAYHQYLIETVIEHVTPRMVDEVFTMIFQDREMLLALNLQLSDVINSMKQDDYQEYLEKDGVMVRWRNWPKWMKDGIGCRDKHKCVLCSNDVSGQISVGEDRVFDHMVPLSDGGTNDPCNIQLLCLECNQAKGASEGKTKNRQMLYW